MSMKKRGRMKEHFDLGSIAVILITLILFIVALFTKGFTHDLLLEAGVFNSQQSMESYRFS